MRRLWRQKYTASCLTKSSHAQMQHRDEILTPSQLNTLARDLLESAFPLVWIEGELGNVSRPSSGHLYVTLKDAQAQVRCAMFKPKSQWLTFQPREGLRVLARGRLTLYEARGDYQIVLDHLEEAGEGRCVGPLNNYVSGSKPKACSILHANSLYLSIPAASQ